MKRRMALTLLTLTTSVYLLDFTSVACPRIFVAAFPLRSRFRRRHRAALRDARRGGAASGRERCAHHRRLLARRRALDARARAQR